MLTPIDLARSVLIEGDPPKLYAAIHRPDPGPLRIPFTSSHDHYLAYGSDDTFTEQMLERMVVNVREHHPGEALILVGRTFDQRFLELQEYGITTLMSDEWPSGYYCVTTRRDRPPVNGEACVLSCIWGENVWLDWEEKGGSE